MTTHDLTERVATLNGARRAFAQMRRAVQDAKDRERIITFTIERDLRASERFHAAKNEGERKALLDAMLLTDPIAQVAYTDARRAEVAYDQARLEMECHQDAFRAAQLLVLERFTPGSSTDAALGGALQHLIDGVRNVASEIGELREQVAASASRR